MKLPTDLITRKCQGEMWHIKLIHIFISCAIWIKHQLAPCGDILCVCMYETITIQSYYYVCMCLTFLYFIQDGFVHKRRNDILIHNATKFKCWRRTETCPAQRMLWFLLCKIGLTKLTQKWPEMVKLPQFIGDSYYGDSLCFGGWGRNQPYRFKNR